MKKPRLENLMPLLLYETVLLCRQVFSSAPYNNNKLASTQNVVVNFNLEIIQIKHLYQIRILILGLKYLYRILI